KPRTSSTRHTTTIRAMTMWLCYPLPGMLDLQRRRRPLALRVLDHDGQLQAAELVALGLALESPALLQSGGTDLRGEPGDGTFEGDDETSARKRDRLDRGAPDRHASNGRSPVDPALDEAEASGQPGRERAELRRIAAGREPEAQCRLAAREPRQ